MVQFYLSVPSILLLCSTKKQPTLEFNHFVFLVISNCYLLYVRDNKAMNTKLHAVNQLMIYMIYLDSKNASKYFWENIIQKVKLRG